MAELSDTISITINGKARDIFMSFGLRQTLAKLVGDPSRLGNASDIELEEQLLLACVAERSKTGKVQKGFQTVEDFEISSEDADAVQEWAAEHVLDFFVKRVLKALDLMKKQEEKLPEELKSSSSSNG